MSWIFRGRHGLLGGLLIAAIVGASGCGRRADFVSAYPETELKSGARAVTDAEALRERVQVAGADVPEMTVNAGVKVRSEGTSGFISVRALYQQPDRIRLRGSRLDVTLFDLLLLGDRVHLYLREEGARFDGSLEELARVSGAIGGLSPRELVSSLLVLGQLREVLADGKPAVVSDEGEHFLVAARVGSQDAQGFWLVRKSDGLVREFLLRDKAGAPQVRVYYEAYGLHGSASQPMPERLRLQVVPTGASFEVKVSEYELAPELKPAQFEPSKARRVRALADLGGAGS